MGYHASQVRLLPVFKQQAAGCMAATGLCDTEPCRHESCPHDRALRHTGIGAVRLDERSEPRMILIACKKECTATRSTEPENLNRLPGTLLKNSSLQSFAFSEENRRTICGSCRRSNLHRSAACPAPTVLPQTVCKLQHLAVTRPRARAETMIGQARAD